MKLVLGVMVGVTLAGLMTRSDMDRISRAHFPLFKITSVPILSANNDYSIFNNRRSVTNYKLQTVW